MSVFGIQTENNIKVIKFMDDTNKRLQSSNIVKNPFDGMVKRIANGDNDLTYCIIMDPIYPKFYLWGLVLFAIALLFNGFQVTWWSFPGALLFSTGLAWSFILPMLGSYFGLRKFGYKGKIKYITAGKVLKLEHLQVSSKY